MVKAESCHESGQKTAAIDANDATVARKAVPDSFSLAFGEGRVEVEKTGANEKTKKRKFRSHGIISEKTLRNLLILPRLHFHDSLFPVR
jgi:hypothetical protein